MSITAMADDGVPIPVYDCALTFTYDAGNITELITVYKEVTYKQTFTYTGSDITAISIWEAQ